MIRADHLSNLINNFIFRDRRIVDQSFVCIRVFWAEDEFLSQVASSVKPSERQSGPTIRIGEGIIGNAFFRNNLTVIPDASTASRELGDPRIRSLIACPIGLSGNKYPYGVISLESRRRLEFRQEEITNLKVLSSIIAFERFDLSKDEIRRIGDTRISSDYRRNIEQALIERNMTQDELISHLGGSIYRKRWLIGMTKPPTRTVVRMYAESLGILSDHQTSIIRTIDITPQLLELLRRAPSRLQDLSPEQFELLVADRLDQMGYAVRRTGVATAKDGGIDIIAIPKVANAASFLLAVQVKHHRNRPTGRNTIDRLLSWQNSAFRLGMVVTNTYFTKDAIWAASQDPARYFLRLRGFDDLTRWLHDIFDSDMDFHEIPSSIELAPGVMVQVPKTKVTDRMNL